MQNKPLLDKETIVMIVLTILGMIFFEIISNCFINAKITSVRKAYEADLRAKGLLEPRRPQKEIYMPLDREDANRQDSTGVFLKTAKKEFGTQQSAGLETVDYASQTNAYDNRVREIKQAEAKRLADQRKQQAELDRKMGKTSSVQNTVKKPNKQNNSGTVINKLQTSGRKNNKSTMFKK